MKRIEILVMGLKLAQANGFDFRSWYQVYIDPEWPGPNEAIRLLTQQSRYIALLYSHEFAMAVWMPGEQMHILVPTKTYTQKNRYGEYVTVTRRQFTRRTTKSDAWQYHLKQMVICKDPLSYLRRFLPVPEDIQPEKK